jgi:hypothetical protein
LLQQFFSDYFGAEFRGQGVSSADDDHGVVFAERFFEKAAS